MIFLKALTWSETNNHIKDFNTSQFPTTRSCPVGYECPDYDTKQSDGEVPVMLELWGMWSTPLLPLLPGRLWPSMVAPDRALSMG